MHAGPIDYIKGDQSLIDGVPFSLNVTKNSDNPSAANLAALASSTDCSSSSIVVSFTSDKAASSTTLDVFTWSQNQILLVTGGVSYTVCWMSAASSAASYVPVGTSILAYGDLTFTRL